VTGLRRFAAPPVPAEPEPERCGLCGETLTTGGHRHLVDVRNRSLVCACTACALLFTRDGAAASRYRTVPDRVLRDPAAPLTEAEWATLRIPVAIAFFFLNSSLDRIVASYPSPAGVTECELDLDAWDQIAGTHPLLRALAPDTEAILVIRGETFLVPVDVCYALAGTLRLNWHGFDGGAEARHALETFLTDLRRRSRDLEAVPRWQN
jgi:hypothetical protein